MTDRELMRQALEALEWAADHIPQQKEPVCDCPVCVADVALRERLAQPDDEPVTFGPKLAQRTHWEGCEEVHPECRKPETEAHELSDKAWAAIWEEFAWESEVTTDKEFQEEMVKKHGKGHYYMDAEETWNRQKDLIQKLVNARLKEQNA